MLRAREHCHNTPHRTLARPSGECAAIQSPPTDCLQCHLARRSTSLASTAKESGKHRRLQVSGPKSGGVTAEQHKSKLIFGQGGTRFE